MDPTTKETQLFRGFMLGISAAIVLTAIMYFSQQWNNAKEQKQILENLERQLQEASKIPEEKIAYPDFYTATNEMHKTQVITDLASYVKKDTGEIVGQMKVGLTRVGKISRGYLIVKASVDQGRPLTIYDSIYLKLGDSGGHILRNKSLKTPNEPITSLLYPLNSIPYLRSIPYNENKQGEVTDWLTAINNSTKPIIFGFLSSSRAGGTLKEVTFAYECEPETPDCSLSVIK